MKLNNLVSSLRNIYSFYALPNSAVQSQPAILGETEFGGVPPWSQVGRFAVMRPDAVEAIRQPLYDRMLYPNAGTNQLRFFQLFQGQGAGATGSTASGNAGNAKTLEDTNMEAAGMIPSPKAFLATSIELRVEPGSTATAAGWTRVLSNQQNATTTVAIGGIANAQAMNDVQAILEGGWLDLFIISKSYLQVSRMDSFPPKSFIDYKVENSSGSTLNVITLGTAARAVGRPFYLNPPVLFMPNTTFNVTLNWPVIVPTPSGFASRIECRLDGFLYRNAQ